MVRPGRPPYDLGHMQGAERSLRGTGRRALIGVATLLVGGALAVVSSQPSPGSLGTGGVARLVAGAAAPSAPTNSSYGIVDAAGGVMTFGGAAYSGDTLGYTLDKPVVGAAAIRKVATGSSRPTAASSPSAAHSSGGRQVDSR